jgi:hypothetical protein
MTTVVFSSGRTAITLTANRREAEGKIEEATGTLATATPDND